MANTVLYIDDNADNITLVGRLLKTRSDLQFLGATNGEDGIALANSAMPRLILLDRRLPDLSGNEVLARLKASAQTKEIPVIILSGDSAGEYAEELRGLGAAEFLAKPFSLDELQELIKRFCS
jgi:CheY-like chemotaxis protein